MAGQLRIGVDTGGTFTDIVLDDGQGAGQLTHKLLSTPDDPARAVLKGIEAILAKYSITGGDSPFVIHGSTVATNALLEGKGAKAAFVTTAGFEDTLHICRQNRPELYELAVKKPQPPVERRHCLGVAERTAYNGEILLHLEGSSIAELITRLKKLGVESIAISLLHSYANPAHEQAIGEAIRRDLPGVHLTVSSELLPEFREYERAATCLANAVVAPPMGGYVKRLGRRLGEDKLRIMASAGGSLPVSVIADSPVHTILSGPAGGGVGAFAMAGSAGAKRIITFDMGGTSTDVSLCDGELSRTTESEIAGLPVRLPMIDIHTVGAGGGSVAWLDSAGALHVGPESTGADPGPACYGRQRGDLRATVTDAHLLLGHIPPAAKLAGEMPLDHAAASQALETVARSAGLSLNDTADGIVRIAEATMARAIQRISVERGHDPRQFALVPFGGAGGLHAAALAKQLGIRRVLVPPDPGLLSAIGMLSSAPLYSFSVAVMQRLPCVDGSYRDPARHESVRQALASLNVKATTALENENIPARRRKLIPALDLRYSGQSYELTIPLDGSDTVAAFQQQHERLYGYSPAGKELEVVAARILATADTDALQLSTLRPREGGGINDINMGHTIHTVKGELPCKLFRREDLARADVFEGPAIITEYSSTTLVPAGWRCKVNELGFLVLDRLPGEEFRDE